MATTQELQRRLDKAILRRDTIYQPVHGNNPARRRMLSLRLEQRWLRVMDRRALRRDGEPRIA